MAKSDGHEWHDYRSPRDFYGHAQQLAKKYCTENSTADKPTVYNAAQEAAETYDRSIKLKQYKFKAYVYWRIRNALYQRKFEEDD